MNVLVTGGTGLLGAALIDHALRHGAHVAATHQRNAPHVRHERLRWLCVDHADLPSVERVVEDSGAAVVVHTAAMAVPAEAEKDPERARLINTQLPRAVARACNQSGARLLHVSTDLVFDGTRGDRREDDDVNPISTYGRTKALAEEEVAAACANHVVARTSLLLGPSPRGDRGVEELLANAVARGEKPSLFTDEFRTPVAAACLARILFELGSHTFRGVLHATGAEAFSRHALGLLVMEAFGLPPSSVTAASLAGSAPAVPPRAPNTTLNTTRLRQLAPAVTLPRSIRDVLRGHPRAV
jgi:dTDP-4-dehydrorhamnose reductase